MFGPAPPPEAGGGGAIGGRGPADLRERMGAAAVAAARAVGYRSAGTCEFLLAADGGFYFLEMNTRIQVEHPVTELVYGVDLVRQQLRIARGLPVLVPSDRWEPRGWSIECRITSEDPANGFLPSTGRIAYLRTPSGPGVRWDGGAGPGDEISLHYDSLLGKLIVWAPDREQAIGRMRRALDELMVVGVSTNLAFHRRLMADAEFIRGAIDTQFLDRRADLLTAEIPARPRHHAGSGRRPRRGRGAKPADAERGWRGGGRQRLDPGRPDRRAPVSEVLRIERIAAGGDGVGRLEDGRTVFVPRTAPGDLVELRDIRLARRFARAGSAVCSRPGRAGSRPAAHTTTEMVAAAASCSISMTSPADGPAHHRRRCPAPAGPARCARSRSDAGAGRSGSTGPSSPLAVTPAGGGPAPRPSPGGGVRTPPLRHHRRRAAGRCGRGLRSARPLFARGHAPPGPAARPRGPAARHLATEGQPGPGPAGAALGQETAPAGSPRDALVASRDGGAPG